MRYSITEEVATLKQQILTLLAATPGLTDRELTIQIRGPEARPQSINQAARKLAAADQVFRRTRPDGNLGNYLDSRDVEDPSLIPAGPQPQQGRSAVLSEDDVKRNLQNWLEAAGWHVHVIWGREHGIDIEARRGSLRWVIEVKGSGSRDPMRLNYFLAILGELLQRMTDPNARMAKKSKQSFARRRRLKSTTSKSECNEVTGR